MMKKFEVFDKEAQGWLQEIEKGQGPSITRPRAYFRSNTLFTQISWHIFVEMIEEIFVDIKSVTCYKLHSSKSQSPLSIEIQSSNRVMREVTSLDLSQPVSENQKELEETFASLLGLDSMVSLCRRSQHKGSNPQTCQRQHL
jgi:hypothetical protein